MDKRSDRMPLPHAHVGGLITVEPMLRRVSASELLAGQRELVIVHNCREYRLRLTSKGRLILTA